MRGHLEPTIHAGFRSMDFVALAHRRRASEACKKGYAGAFGQQPLMHRGQISGSKSSVSETGENQRGAEG